MQEDVEAIDLDGDRRDDVAVVGSFSFSVTTALSDGTGGFRSPVMTYRASRPGPTSAKGADLDSDGREELLVSSLADPRSGAVEVLTSTGTATLSSAGVFATAPFPQDPATGDVNDDGRLDAVTVSPGSTSTLLGR